MSATAQHKARASGLESITYADLYRRWEDGNWRATEIDFAQDRKGWEGLSDIQRRSALWTYSMFFYGEDSVTDNLSPYIDAAPLEEQKYFLASQQVDEARHAVFFSRFFSEVIGSGDGIAAGLAYTEPQLNWSYRQVFGRLDRMADELRRDRSLPKFAQAIALYHLVVEATLAQPGQHFIEDFFVKEGTMPGFSAGMKNVSRDEQRHIGFGVKVLSELFAESEECKAAVVELLREVMPFTSGVFVPPGWDRRYTEEYGFTLEDIYTWGFKSVQAKWRQTGYPMEEMPSDVFPLDWSLSPEERTARVVKLMEAGILGEPNGHPDSSPEIQRLYFDTVERTVDHSAVNGRPVTIQWRFSDAPSWYLRIENGSTRAEQGETPDPDVTLESSWADWIHVTTHGGDPRRAILARKIRPHGSLRQLWRMQRIFPR
ncbi:MAG TPA: ribonucleotide-diphosphate reductase subunit beta [Solirubrobacterales bacterium]|nr:ribonucleotide-diphosphate reductase subunit beta [Solirubrobacterales bacterium]